MSAARGSGQAVVDGVLKTVSASQVKMYRACSRSWFGQKVLGLRPESTGAQNTGTAVHAQLEGYLLRGDAILHPAAQQVPALRWEDGKPVLPSSSADLLVEIPLEEPSLFIDSVQYRGFIDFIQRDGARVDVIDFKTTSAKRWAKTSEELKTDVQMGSYAYWARQRWPDIERIRLAHLNMLSRGKSAWVVEAEPSWAEIDSVWASIAETVVSMKQCAAIKAFEDVEPSFGDACDAYGGCPFYYRCHADSGAFDDYEPDDPESILISTEENEP